MKESSHISVRQAVKHTVKESAHHKADNVALRRRHSAQSGVGVHRQITKSHQPRIDNGEKAPDGIARLAGWQVR